MIFIQLYICGGTNKDSDIFQNDGFFLTEQKNPYGFKSTFGKIATATNKVALVCKDSMSSKKCKKHKKKGKCGKKKIFQKCKFTCDKCEKGKYVYYSSRV